MAICLRKVISTFTSENTAPGSKTFSLMPKNKLNRSIGVWGLSFNIINFMIGAGIFALPAIVASGLGPASFMAYLFCGLLIALVMLCFAEVGSAMEADGGLYGYIDRALGEYFGFKAAAILIIATISADAAIANALIDVVDTILPFEISKLIRTICIFLIFGGLAYINVRGAKKGLSMVSFFTLAKLIPLLLLIMLSLPQMQIGNLRLDGMPSMKDLSQVSLILFFAFMGSEAGLSVSGEVRNPQRTIPRAILIAVSSVLVLYILIQTVSVGVLGPSLTNFKENPLGELAKFVIGPIGLTLMIVGAGVSMFGNLSSSMLSNPRVIYGAAKDRVIPIKALARIHPVFTTPKNAILVYAGLDIIFASLGGFQELAVLSASMTLLLYFGMVMALISLRIKKYPRLEGSFMIPGGYVVPVLAGIVILWFLANNDPYDLLTIGGIIVGLSLIYFILIRKIRVSSKN